MVRKDLNAQENNSTQMDNILLSEVGRHPLMEINDLYKFIHQAAFGSEHAVRDTAFVRKWMENEVKELDYSYIDSLMDILSPNGQMVRINLRPWLLKGYDTEILLAAFIHTANSQITSGENFREYWDCARQMVKNNTFRFSLSEFNEFYKQREKEGFPAIHHSAKYEELYKPAYRVIDLEFLPDDF